jgi:hypothetical protein
LAPDATLLAKRKLQGASAFNLLVNLRKKANNAGSLFLSVLLSNLLSVWVLVYKDAETLAVSFYFFAQIVLRSSNKMIQFF